MRAAWLLALLGACTGASSDLGLGALLRVAGAQFRPGPFPGDEGGPAGVAIATTHDQVVIGRFVDKLRGTLAPGANGAVIGIGTFADGACVPADGAWLVAADPPDVINAPDNPTAAVTFGLAAEFPVGPACLLLAGGDPDGRIGARVEYPIVAEADLPPHGTLVIALAWDGAADLDLHVIDALGGEAWADNPNTYTPPPPGTPEDPLEFMKHGILDHDGNHACHRDGRPNEHVIWTQPAPAGSYIARVDTRQMCGAPSAAWFAEAYTCDATTCTLLTSCSDGPCLARGVASPDETLLPHGAGAGVTALQFELP